MKVGTLDEIQDIYSRRYGISLYRVRQPRAGAYRSNSGTSTSAGTRACSSASA